MQTDLSEIDTGLLIAVIVWVVAASAILLNSWRRNVCSVGLPFAYVLNLSLVHLFGGAIYLLPWYVETTTSTVDLTIQGFLQSTCGIVAFVIGAIFVAPAIVRRQGPGMGRIMCSRHVYSMAWSYLGLGLLSFVVVQPIVGRLPSLASVVSVSWYFVVVGLGLGCWWSSRDRRRRMLLLWLLVSALLPFLTLSSQGFLGYGVVSALTVMALVATVYRPRWQTVAIGLIGSYLALMLFVTYFRDRSAIRDVVWGGASADTRVGLVINLVGSLHWFDPTNIVQLRFIDLRLNQNLLVGAAIQYLQVGGEDFAHGRTLVDAALSVIPRALWPDKPIEAGSGDLVSTYTGLRFSPGTAVGIGHVLELYANFGTPGVAIGFLLLGTVLGGIDYIAAKRLGEGDIYGFVRWYLPALSMLNVQGAFVELTAGVAASVIAAGIAELVIRHANPWSSQPRLWPRREDKRSRLRNAVKVATLVPRQDDLTRL